MKKLLLILLWINASIVTIAQTILIQGKVTDTKSEPIIGATVAEVGTATGTVTNANGEFSLNVSSDASLAISFIGYKTEIIKVNQRTYLEIQLQDDTQILDEVVVTGYGGTRNRSKVVNSISSVNQDLLKNGLFSNPGQALTGTIPGLRVVQATGNPSAVPTIILRGGTNLDGSGSPILIVDGQIRNSFSDINPTDIESIDILKDAGATALYGARANNGVILVTTKRGKPGQTQINVKAKMGLNYFNSQLDFMNAGDYLYWMRSAYQRSSEIFKSETGQWVGTQTLSTLTGANAYGTGNIYWADADKKIPASGLTDSRAMWSPMKYSDDLAFLLDQGWEKMIDPVYGDELIYKEWSPSNNIKSPAISQDYNVSFQGGSDKGSYYSNIGYNLTEGNPLDMFYERISATLNADYKVKEWITSTTNLYFVKSRKNVLPNGQIDTKKNEDLFFTGLLSMPPTMRETNPSGNLAINLDKYKRDFTSNKWSIGESFKIDIMKDLYIRLNTIWLIDQAFNESFNQDLLSSANQWDRSRTSSTYFNRELRQTYNAIAYYDTNFLRDHYLNILAGFEFYDEYLEGFSAAGSGAPTDDFQDLELTTTKANMRSVDSWHERQRIMSSFGRLDYDYMGKYLLSATLRLDGYSLLLGDNTWGTFPGVSIGWLFSKENFMNNLSSIISYGKLRASYGLNGNVSNIRGDYVRNGAYDLQGKYGTTPYGGAIGYYLNTLPNTGLRWEKSNTFEIALDLRLLDKINANVTFYTRNTEDKYADIPLPGSSGIDNYRTNNGKIRNMGLEYELGYRIAKSSQWTWDLNINGAFNKNKIIELPFNGLGKNRQNAYQVYNPKSPHELTWVSGYQEGEEPGILYAFQYEGIYSNEEEIPGNLIDKTSGDNGSNGLWLYGPEAWASLPESQKILPNGKAASLPIQPGDVKWTDVNKDGVIDNFDMVKMGNKIPRWSGGINSNLRYKDFVLLARMDYGLGFTILDSRTPWIMGNMVGLYNTIDLTKDTWSPNNTTGKYPIYTWADQLEKRNYARPSSLFVYKGNYLAFREISLTYSLPRNLMSYLGIQGRLDISITAQNLGYLTEAKTVPFPDISNEQGIWSNDGPDRSGGYPLPRTIIFGANLIF